MSSADNIRALLGGNVDMSFFLAFHIAVHFYNYIYFFFSSKCLIFIYYVFLVFFLCGLSTGQNVDFPVTENSPFSVHPPPSYIDLLFSSYEHELLTTRSLFYAEWGRVVGEGTR